MTGIPTNGVHRWQPRSGVRQVAKPARMSAKFKTQQLARYPKGPYNKGLLSVRTLRLRLRTQAIRRLAPQRSMKSNRLSSLPASSQYHSAKANTRQEKGRWYENRHPGHVQIANNLLRLPSAKIDALSLLAGYRNAHSTIAGPTAPTHVHPKRTAVARGPRRRPIRPAVAGIQPHVTESVLQLLGPRASAATMRDGKGARQSARATSAIAPLPPDSDARLPALKGYQAPWQGISTTSRSGDAPSNELAMQQPINPLDTGPRSSVRNLSTSDGRSQRAGAVVLDGSTLGRWVITHLEQVLSRPQSGMTGVDPRAARPRSRLSPF